MVIIYTVKLCNVYLTGSVGYWLCALLFSDSVIWCGTNSSAVTLVFITVERSLKVVHAAWSIEQTPQLDDILSNGIRLDHPFYINLSLGVPNKSVVLDGACFAYAMWDNQLVKLIYTICSFVFLYVAIILIFIIFYWRILIVIRRQAMVMASHNAAGPSTAHIQAQAKSYQIQTNVIKTMIFISVFYAISYLPANVYVFFMAVNPNPTPLGGTYYMTVITAFLYVCAIPFIYAIKFDPVRKVLLSLIPCTMTSE